MDELHQFRDALRRGMLWYRRHGLRASLDKAASTLGDRRAPSLRSYEAWTRRAPAEARHGGQGLRLSLLVPVKDPLPQHLDALYASVAGQDHGRWELLFADDGSVEPVVGRRLSDLARKDRRVRLLKVPRPGGISRASNAAAGASSGDVLLLVDHDDVLARGILGEVAAAFAADPRLDLLYTDEDHLAPWGARVAPVFKPGASSWLLLSFNYVTHLLAIRRPLFEAVGGLRPEVDGAQDHDLALRAFEKARRVGHLPRIGYHWRQVAGSVSASTTAKPWAFAAGRRSIEDACRRRGLPLAAIEPGRPEGVWRLRFLPPAEPRAVRVVLYGPDAGARRWRDMLAARGDLVRVLGVSEGRWPSSPEGDGDWLVIDGGVDPDASGLAELLGWRALPGVGAVAAAASNGKARRHLGYSVRRDGLAEPVLAGVSSRAAGPGLLAAAPREVAGSAGGVLLVESPPEWLRDGLAGRTVDPASVLCLSMSPAVADGAVLFHPQVSPRLNAAQGGPAAPIDLRLDPSWTRLSQSLPADFWRDGSDRFCPRHELLAELGLPPPANAASAGGAWAPAAQPAPSSSRGQTTV